MNFKTTVLLLVLLVGVGGYVLFTRDRGGAGDVPPVPAVHTVLDVKPADVSALTVNGADGKPALSIEKADTAWRLTAPVTAPADAFKVSSLIDDLTTNLKSSNVVATTVGDAPHTGVDHPQYTVELTVAGKPVKLAVGDRLAVGDGVYAQVAGRDTVDIVPATLLETLARPASDLRNTQLFNTTSADVKQLSITRHDGSTLKLEKTAGAWRVVAPQAMPADASAVDDLLATVINLTPVAFVDDPKDATGLTHPADVVSFSSAAPSTQPAASQPTLTTLRIGGYDDVQKKNVFAAVGDGTVVKVAATILETLNKTPLDLRDKAVVDVDPAKVTRLEIATAPAVTTVPAATPATKSIVLARRPPTPAVVGPLKGATTAPTTAPTSDWVLASGGPADDAKVTSLLGQFHPLRADKYLESSAIKNPARRFTVTLRVGASAPVVVHVDDPGHDLSLIGTCGGLTFQLPSTMAADLAGDFKKASAVTDAK